MALRSLLFLWVFQLAFLSGCNKDGNELIVYSGRTEKLVGQVLTDFEAETGVRVKVQYAKTATLAATLLEEAGSSPADVFIAQDASTLALLADEMMFIELPATTIKKVPAGFSDANGMWVGTSGRARVLAYNTSVTDVPSTLGELADPKWNGRVGWAPENASFQSFVAAMLQLEGEDKTREWLTSMLANDPKSFPSNTPMVMAISRGEIDLGLTNHYYLHRLKIEHGQELPVANHYFRDGTAASLVNIAGVGIVKTTDKPGEAQQLVSYLLSREAQDHFVTYNHEFPLAAGAPTLASLPSISDLASPEVNLAELDNLEATVRLLRETKVLP